MKFSDFRTIIIRQLNKIYLINLYIGDRKYSYFDNTTGAWIVLNIFENFIQLVNSLKSWSLNQKAVCMGNIINTFIFDILFGKWVWVWTQCLCRSWEWPTLNILETSFVTLNYSLQRPSHMEFESRYTEDRLIFYFFLLFLLF